MALTSTIYKLQLHISDLNRQYYNSHQLTLARHPSETEIRLFARLLAFALHADEYLSFGKGLSNTEEADIWHIDDTGAIKQWIQLGEPEEKRIRQICARAETVNIYSYSKRASEVWHANIAANTERFKHLHIALLDPISTEDAQQLMARNGELFITIEDNMISASNGSFNTDIKIQVYD